MQGSDLVLQGKRCLRRPLAIARQVLGAGRQGGKGQTFAKTKVETGRRADAAAVGAREILDYSRSYTSWTAGALWKATPDLSIFGRASRGGRFNSDRQTVSGKFNPDGSLCTLCAFCVGVAAPSQPFLNDSVLQAVELPATWPGRLIVGVADTPERPPRLSLA